MSTASTSDNKEAGLLPIRPTANLPLRTPKSAKTDEDTFTRNQLAFIVFYCRGLSPMAAYVKAGYSPKGDPYALLYSPKVWNEIQKRLRVHFEREQITSEDVLRNIHQVAHANVLDYLEVMSDGSFKINLANISREDGKAIQEVGYDAAGRPRIKLVDKIAAIRLEGQLMGMLKDRLEVTGKDGAPLSIRDFDAIIQNTTINIQNNTTQERHQVSEGEVIDSIASEHPRPMLDAPVTQ